MVEKIEVSRDEVIHFPWLDHTWIYIYYTNSAVTTNPFWGKLLVGALKYGIRETTGKSFEDITNEKGYIFVKYDTNEIIKILKNACAWLLTCNLTVKDPTIPKGVFFTENKEHLLAFFEETKKMLEEKTYKYYYQSIDGMN